MGIVFNGLDNEGKQEMNEKNLNIDLIITDRGTQSRVEVNEPTVADYAQAVLDGDKFPPIIVFHDGTDYFLADGFHRYLAHLRAKRVSIFCEVKRGTARDAKRFGFGANNKNGLRPTIADRRKSVTEMVEDLEWQDLSDREIARECGVSHTFVATVRKEVEGRTVVESKPKSEKTGKKTSTKATAEPKESNTSGTKVELLPPVDGYDKEMVDAIIAENTKLNDRLAIKAMVGTEDEKDLAKETIEELREELKNAYIEIYAITKSRNSFQNECAQLKKQIASLQRKIKQYEAA
jgi:hypothetical protein